MQFPTFTFTLFLLAALTLWWGVMRPDASARARAAVLLGISLVFYAWADWRWVGVVLGVGLISRWGCVWALQAVTERGRQWRLGAVVTVLIGHLVAWKYTLWLVAERNDLAHLWGASAWALPEWAYPVGLSFFTFHAVALTLAAGRRRIALPSTLETLTHVAFFPAILAGPVLRADAILPRLRTPFVWREVPWLDGLGRIAIGMGFKWVLASQAASWADPVFAGMADSGGAAWWGVHAYALQIFFDFAGYSHMAIGVALLLGFRLPENFTQPYLATSFREFWHRWHRSLSFFFRDHLYIEAFGGNQHGKTLALLSAAATMVVSGLWHGASITFLVWGAWHAAALVIERLLPGRARWPAWLGWLVTFEGMVWGWVFFRAEDLTSVRLVFSQAFGSLPWAMPSLDLSNAVIMAWGLAMAATLAIEREALTGLGRWSQFADRAEAPWWSNVATTVCLTAYAALVIALGPVGVPPFIYNGF